MVYCDNGYGCPSVRPRVSDPATYCASTPRVQLPAVARWHTHLGCLMTPIHEISGLGALELQKFPQRNTKMLSQLGICILHIVV